MHTSGEMNVLNSPARQRATHKKSRLGCFACKARRTKCDESRPVCKRCAGHGSRCRYPRTSKFASGTILRLLPGQSLSISPRMIKSEDCRLFHHFLAMASPHLPAGNDEVWASTIPQLASQNQHLMHAMLGLGASHLHWRRPEAQNQVTAIEFRGRAMAGLRAALTKTTWTRAEVDATIAMVYILAFQAQYMKDGLSDFVVMVRGCALAVRNFTEAGAETSFDLRQLQSGTYLCKLVPDSEGFGLVDKNIVQKGLEALNRVWSIIETDENRQFFSTIKNALLACLQSTSVGFMECHRLYTELFTTDWTKFTETFNASNGVTYVLQAFSTIAQLLMVPVTHSLFVPSSKAPVPSNEVQLVLISWALHACDVVPENYQIFVEWPRAVIDKFS
ncbi:hypothetical protein EDD37DRAFT_50875 [Exophiala viscosa]|uniref:Zn(2)-C6 fungal-type domain-containing protein n=1 Tax=Exophiala viscosa TaxID=2486360 RepID=A0AAN6E4K0_9EURO|nr:hypothetical protein EDD36DRAFT_152419 [Exophiala viscosa]KAI1629427.1 hypothetical protein EDD37DRAFT_50875 [Exophiala viscosa]